MASDAPESPESAADAEEAPRHYLEPPSPSCANCGHSVLAIERGVCTARPADAPSGSARLCGCRDFRAAA
jgi:hypothetical protein